MFDVGVGAVPGEYVGYTWWFAGESRGTILVEAGTPYTADLVLRMELMHAAGVSGHPWGGGAGHWCPAAVAYVSGLPGVVRLVPEVELRRPCAVAARWWNGAVGWEKYVVE